MAVEKDKPAAEPSAEGTPPSPVDPDELEQRVLGWLGQQGYPLEFQVARAFTGRGFTVTPSHYVEVERRPREIDVLAVKSTSVLADRLNFKMFVECKWSKKNPWVVFASEAAAQRPWSRLDGIPANPIGEALLWLFEGPPDVFGYPPFVAAGTQAHAGRQTLTDRRPDGPDAFYSAMQSVTVIAHAGVYGPVGPLVDPLSDVSFAFPLVVIDAPLFEATLSEDSGELRIRPISRARVNWRGARADAVSHVDIVTAPALDAFVAECAAGLDEAAKYLLIAHSEVREALRRGSLDPIRYRLRGLRTTPPIAVPSLLRDLIARLA